MPEGELVAVAGEKDRTFGIPLLILASKPCPCRWLVKRSLQAITYSSVSGNSFACVRALPSFLCAANEPDERFSLLNV